MLKRLILIVFIAFTACTQVASGTIVKKQYSPAWIQYVQTCVAYNSNGVCAGWIFQPIYWPEEYEFKLRADNEENIPVDKRDTSWVDVSPQDYASHSVGERFVTTEG